MESCYDPAVMAWPWPIRLNSPPVLDRAPAPWCPFGGWPLAVTVCLCSVGPLSPGRSSGLRHSVWKCHWGDEGELAGEADDQDEDKDDDGQGLLHAGS